ncbi:hypothetical protein RJT34_20477 [Clitoria ternatea]|uniref:Uncharacterized protein n=1 Tax=Clitoria ternatea TaxID=43366 RepID=A0AAN9ITP4_CLITE
MKRVDWASWRSFTPSLRVDVGERWCHLQRFSDAQVSDDIPSEECFQRVIVSFKNSRRSPSSLMKKVHIPDWPDIRGFAGFRGQVDHSREQNLARSVGELLIGPCSIALCFMYGDVYFIQCHGVILDNRCYKAINKEAQIGRKRRREEEETYWRMVTSTGEEAERGSYQLQ